MVVLKVSNNSPFKCTLQDLTRDTVLARNIFQNSQPFFHFSLLSVLHEKGIVVSAF